MGTWVGSGRFTAVSLVALDNITSLKHYVYMFRMDA